MSRVKQAYALNAPDVEGLLHALSPECVFPYALWEKAYAAYWKSPAAECSRRYKFDNPPFPETGQLPEKYFPTDVFAQWIVDFFYELARRISVTDLENGFDYVVESTYDDKLAINEADRDFIFYHIKKAGSNIANATRTKGLREINVNLSAPHILLRIFPDTIAVDKVSAIHYLSVVQKYPFIQEVKGITHSLVESIIKEATQKMSPVPETIPEPSRIITETHTPSAVGQEAPLNPLPEVTDHGQQEGMTLIPRALWKGKKGQQVCDDMRVAGYEEDAPIAHALYYWAGIKNFTKIGTILRGEDITESARDKHARKHLKLAEGRYYTE